MKTMIELDTIMNEQLDTLVEDKDEGWDELISDLDRDYLDAFRSGDEMALQDAANELYCFGYDSDHTDRLESVVFQEMGDYLTYLENPDWFDEDEIPPRPDVHPGLMALMYNIIDRTEA